MAANPLQKALDMRPATPGAKSRSRLGYERQTTSTLDIPIQTFGVWDSVQLIQGALSDLEQGTFLNASVLCDAMGRDDRITATLSARVNGLLALPLEFKPGVDSAKGQKVAEDLEDSWERIFPDGELAQLLKWGRLVGAAPGEITWSTVNAPNGGSGKRWLPRLKVWHPQFLQWRWDWRDYSLVTMSEGVVQLEVGQAHWALYTPSGRYPAWQSGIVRALAIPFLIRWWAYRDWARYSEKHGLPIFKAQVPKGADDDIKRLFFNSLSALGSENTVKLETGDPAQGIFNIELLEPVANTWAGFQGLIEQCNSSIAILLLGQNLTTEVQGGSRAAATVHERVRSDFIQADSRTLATFIREQILKPWAAFNYGDAELAPHPVWEVDPPEDTQKTAQTLLALGQAFGAMKDAGAPLDVRAVLEQLAIPMLTEAQHEQSLQDEADRNTAAAAAAAQAAASAEQGAGSGDAADDGEGSGDSDDAGSGTGDAKEKDVAEPKIDPPMPKPALEGQLYTDALGDKAIEQAALVLGPQRGRPRQRHRGLAQLRGSPPPAARAPREHGPQGARAPDRARDPLAELAGKFAVRREALIRSAR